MPGFINAGEAPSPVEIHSVEELLALPQLAHWVAAGADFCVSRKYYDKPVLACVLVGERRIANAVGYLDDDLPELPDWTPQPQLVA